MQNKDAMSLKSDFEPSLVVDSINGKVSHKIIYFLTLLSSDIHKIYLLGRY